MDYISSAGIRVIMTMKLGNRMVSVLNANEDVIGIFDSTRFIDIAAVMDGKE